MRAFKLSSKACVLFAVGAAVAALLTIAASPSGHGQYQLGGGYIGSSPGMIYDCLQIPLDPAGRTAAVRVNVISYGPDVAGLLEAFGADTVTENTGQVVLTNRDSGLWRFVSYGVKQGNPPGISAILVYSGTLTYTGPDVFTVKYTLDVYPGPANAMGLPNADLNADGLPDQGTTPFMSIPGGTGTAKRVLP